MAVWNRELVSRLSLPISTNKGLKFRVGVSISVKTSSILIVTQCSGESRFSSKGATTFRGLFFLGGRFLGYES